MHRNVEFSC